MKYLCMIPLFVSASLFAQSTQIANDELYDLAKVWGVMKYYHPAVSQGKVDWDSVLLTTLTDRSRLTEDQIISNWFHIADGIPYEHIEPETNTCDSITLRNFDIRWIEQAKHIRSQNKTRLLQLVYAPKDIGLYYSNPTLKTIRFDSRNEKEYNGFSARLKLLELFRVWNAIEYFYPYKYLLDTRWDAVLKKYIPVFKQIQNEQEYKVALMLFTAEIQDTHAGLKNTFQYDVFGKLTAPFTFQIVDDGALITGLKEEKKMQKAGLRIGDFITKVNGKPVKEIMAAHARYVPASNIAVQRREAYTYLFSGTDSVCSLEGIKEDGTAFRTDVERVPRVFHSEWDKDGIPEYHLVYRGKSYEYLSWNSSENRLNPCFRLNDKAYVEFSSLQAADIDTLPRLFEHTKGIVFDLRGYNDDGSLLRIFDLLFTEPQPFGIKTQPDFYRPGRFCFVDNIIHKNYKYIGTKNPDAYKGQVVVLINEYTQSAEEMWAMLFKKIPGVLFAGSQTAGADGNICSIKLVDGNELRFSGLGIYYPDGTETQRIGIQPDMVVRPTLQSLRNKEDILLEKAFELIDEK